MYGGYAGAANPGNPDYQAFELYETMLSGDLNSDDGPGFENNDENSYHVVTGTDTDETAVINDFTITAGNADGAPVYVGGGMYNDYGSPTLVHCTFRENSAHYGGGMCNRYESNPTLIDCTFSGNWATWDGGGMDNRYDSSPTLVDCVFSDDRADDEGGAVYNASSITLTGCAFHRNSAGNGGGGMINLSDDVSLADCTFTANSSAKGGAIKEHGDSALTDCTFNGNSATGWGGGLYIYAASPTLTNCAFTGNVSGGYGGALYNNDGDSVLVNCSFSGNTADHDGGAVYNWSSSDPTLSNCTFANNVAVNGPTIACDSQNVSDASHVSVSGCILWDGWDGVWNDNESTITISYSTVQSGWMGLGNIDLDPLFADVLGPDGVGGTEDDNLRLTPGSPCIDAGDPAYVPQPGETDLDGHARVLCGRVDMGAYEFGIGDADCNETVDLFDFADWAMCMTGPSAGPYAEGCEAFDFEYDADVDLDDYSRFLSVFEGP